MAEKGKIVIVCSLVGRTVGDISESVLELIPLSEEVVKLSSICMECSSTSAAFTCLIKSGKQRKTVALCRGCRQNPSVEIVKDQDSRSKTIFMKQLNLKK